MPQLGPVLAKKITLPPPWDAVLIGVPAFPIPEDKRSSVASVVQKIAGQAADSLHLSAETFLQVEQSDDPKFRDLYAQKVREWIPEVGLGVWPDREPPTTWTVEEFKNLTPGEKPRSLMCQVLWVAASAKMKADAAVAILPFGPLLQILTADDGQVFLEKTTSILLPAITDRTFACYPFYVPLLEVKSLVRATPEQLRTWLCSASIYIRESFEDHGILIISHQPLNPLLEGLGGQFELEPEPVWRIPG